MANMVGFQWGANNRGTIDIVWSCVLVLLTAVWTVVHPNLPAAGEGLWSTIVRRLRWGCACVFAPDFVTLMAAAQWNSASNSVDEMNTLPQLKDHPVKWRMEHAFYANSGGFHVQCPDCKSFPVNARAVHYLVSRGYIPVPEISSDEIWDKSKADIFAKGAAILQGLWLVMQAIAREAQGLPTTPLELFTLAFVVSTVMSYFFWWRKPQNVSTTTVLECESSVVKIRADAGFHSNGWERTPLDWVEEEGRVWTRRRMFRRFGLGNPQVSAKDEEARPQKREARSEKPSSAARQSDPKATEPETIDRAVSDLSSTPTFRISSEQHDPIQRIPDDAIMPPSSFPLKVYASLIIPSLIHSCIHLLGWNLDYPSTVEQQLWRSSAVALAAMSCVAVGASRMLRLMKYKGRYSLVWFWVNAASCQPETERPASKGGKRGGLSPTVTAPEVLLTLSTLLLVLARLFIIVEVIVSLRSQPEGVYVSVNWLGFLPHV